MKKILDKIIRKKKKANYAFVDNENVNVSVQKQGWKLDREKFIHRLKQEYRVEKVYMFMWYIKKYQKMYDFFADLGYTLIFKQVNQNPKIPNKWNTDAELVLHTMIEYVHYDKAIIVTGDGDFACLVEYLRQQSKLSTLIVPNDKRYASTLNEASKGKLISLSDFKDVLAYTPGKPKEQFDESFYDTFYS